MEFLVFNPVNEERKNLFNIGSRVRPQIEHKEVYDRNARIAAIVFISIGLTVTFIGAGIALAAHAPDVLANGANPISDLGMIAKLSGYGLFGGGLFITFIPAVKAFLIARARKKAQSPINKITSKNIHDVLDIYAENEVVSRSNLAGNFLLLQYQPLEEGESPALTLYLQIESQEEFALYLVSLEEDGRFSILTDTDLREVGEWKADLSRSDTWITDRFEDVLRFVASGSGVKNFSFARKNAEEEPIGFSMNDEV